MAGTCNSAVLAAVRGQRLLQNGAQPGGDVLDPHLAGILTLLSGCSCCCCSLRSVQACRAYCLPGLQTHDCLHYFMHCWAYSTARMSLASTLASCKMEGSTFSDADSALDRCWLAMAGPAFMPNISCQTWCVSSPCTPEAP